MSNDFSSPYFDTSLLLHTTSTYFCLLSIFYLEENKRKSGFPFGWINNFLIQICLSLSGAYIAQLYIPSVSQHCASCLHTWKDRIIEP